LPVIAVILSKVTASSFSKMDDKTSEFVSSQSTPTIAGEAALRAWRGAGLELVRLE
jgi:hypothetical protein